MIEKIMQERRPPLSLIKLIESVGILLCVPKSKKKSAYKAPIPSNYDETLQVLLTDFYGAVVKLSLLQSGHLDNDIAVDFYNKTLEPGFDYEDAINAGGLLIRELFNCVQWVLYQLQSDAQRAPVAVHNMLVLVDGQRAGHVALDTATHLCKHGALHILTTTGKGITNYPEDLHSTRDLEHLQADVHRRCKSHYKLLDHCFEIHSARNLHEQARQDNQEGVNSSSSGGGGSHPDASLIQVISDVTNNHKCDTIILGLAHPEKFESTDSIGSLPYWVTWNFPGDLVLAKGVSYVRPFTEVTCGRTFVVYIDPVNDPQTTFLRALRYFKPGDAMVAVAIYPSRDPVGDNQELRFDFGKRHAWLKTDEDLEKEPNRVGWNDSVVDQFMETVDSIMAKSFLQGNSRTRIERTQPGVTIGQTLSKVAFEENAVGMMLRLPENRDVVIQCVHFSASTVVVMK